MKHTIGITDLVEVELTPWGRYAVGATHDRASARATGEDLPERITRADVTVTMPLWEAVRMLGPFIESSLKLPMRAVTVTVAESERAKGLVAQLHEEREWRVAQGKLADERLILIKQLAKAVGLGSTEYCAPEELARRVIEYIEAEVPRVPNDDGLWFYGSRVVEVIGGPHSMRVKHRNGRETPVCKMRDEWGGPARRDPRVEGPMCAGVEDEDMPF